MTIRFIGPLLCGGLLALAMTTSAVAEGKGKKQTKVDGKGVAGVEFVFIQFAGFTFGKCAAAKGVWNAANKTCKVEKKK
jgi:hypothetical protein